MSSVVFMRFVRTFDGRNEYFAGRDDQEIFLATTLTAGGRLYAGVRYEPYSERVSRALVESLDLRLFTEVKKVEEGDLHCAWLGVHPKQ